MVELDEVDEGIREPLDPPGTALNRFVYTFGYQHVPCQFLVDINGTC